MPRKTYPKLINIKKNFHSLIEISLSTSGHYKICKITTCFRAVLDLSSYDMMETRGTQKSLTGAALPRRSDDTILQLPVLHVHPVLYVPFLQKHFITITLSLKHFITLTL